jgi:hypothetical protein
MTGQAEQVLQRVNQAAVQPAPAPARSRPARARQSRLASSLRTPVKTPFTFGYLVVLLGTTLLLQMASPVLTARLLALSSTDAHNLWHRPLFSLLTSALWIAGDLWLPYAVIFAVAVAPLERRIGTLRTAGVFFSGHVLATIATEVPVMVALSAGLLPKADGRWLDIGVSYGFFTTAGALVFLQTGRRRRLALLAMETFIAVFYVTSDPTTMMSVMTFIGHAIAAHFGLLCCGPLLRRSFFHNMNPFADTNSPDPGEGRQRKGWRNSLRRRENNDGIVPAQSQRTLDGDPAMTRVGP